MNVACPRCGVELEYGATPPSFCSQCGCAMSGTNPGETLEYRGDPVKSRKRGDTPPPEKVGHYRLLRLLGAGGMGQVFEAEDTRSGRRVAVKLLVADYSDSKDAVERFRREGRLASLLTHPRCVFIFEADEEDGRPYIVMELMPGRTLEDLVRERGPLPPEEAINKILDVTAGLEQAHKLGIVHRDIKPSNCFLQENGQVKVGDFGLSKSLQQDHRLTRTGSFLGTPLYASPEQIKNESVDAQSDVYSTAAALYYLLTGQAPYQGGDAAATLARIVSEPPTPPRKHRPEIDSQLEQVVMRGLERNRTKRWRNLSEFREALASCLPEQMNAAGLMLRFAAYMVDSVLLMVLTFVTIFALSALSPQIAEIASNQMNRNTGIEMVGLVLAILYYGVSEGVWGWSLGKYLLRLRVTKSRSNAKPGILLGLARATTFFGISNIGTFVMLFIWLFVIPSDLTFMNLAQRRPDLYLLVITIPLLSLICLIVLIAPMFFAGHRGLHDWMTGTRVVLVPAAEHDALAVRAPQQSALKSPGDCPQQLGVFAVENAVSWNEQARVLRARDNSLDRAVWLWLRPAAEPPLSNQRREVTRGARLRWIQDGQEDQWRWDAFVALPACSLQDFVAQHGPLSWRQARPLIMQLAEELVEAERDSTLTAAPTLEQIWIQEDGSLTLLDVAFSADHPIQTPEHAAPHHEDASRLLLSNAITLMLEGRPCAAENTGVRAPLPIHAQKLLTGFFAGEPHGAQELLSALEANNAKPTETRRDMRLAHLALQAFLLSPGLSYVFYAGIMLVFIQVMATMLFDVQTRIFDNAIRQSSGRDLAIAAVNPSLGYKLKGVAQYLVDQQQLEYLQERKAEQTLRHQVAISKNRGLSRQFMVQFNETMKQNLRTLEKEEVQQRFQTPRNWRRWLERQRQSIDEINYVLNVILYIVVYTIPFWPLVWVIWAFLTRGGLSYYFVGLALVRRDGRLAPRWRCAWRALLVWAPLTALLILSGWLDVHHWVTLDTANPRPWLPALVDVLWYGAVVLLLLYVVLALWNPRRGLHDRLSGIYIVPR